MKRAWKWTLGIAGGLVLLTVGTFAWMASQLPPDLKLGSPLPAATLRDAAGKPIDLASFKGRPLFLDFWRST
jgi:cytochrome oxidase Cu insertion factor (SCO1/SenC/PrrC family)